jgi:site-specific DNA-methyltransferase (adenine-specific)
MKKYYEKENFTLYKGDCNRIMPKLEPKSIDMIFADPPYFLSSGGISCQSGKQVSVNKGDWDKSLEIHDKLKYHRKWIRNCREVLKDNGTIWISATLHSVYAIGVALEMEGFSIINNIIWQKTNPSPNLACRCFTHSTETVIWARKQLTSKKKGKHTFNYQEMKD